MRTREHSPRIPEGMETPTVIKLNPGFQKPTLKPQILHCPIALTMSRTMNQVLRLNLSLSFPRVPVHHILQYNQKVNMFPEPNQDLSHENSEIPEVPPNPPEMIDLDAEPDAVDAALSMMDALPIPSLPFTDF